MTDTDAQGRDDERISEIRDLAESYSGLQYVVTDPTRQWPWGSTLAVNEIIDIVRAVPELLAECKRLAGERDALVEDNTALRWQNGDSYDTWPLARLRKPEYFRVGDRELEKTAVCRCCDHSWAWSYVSPEGYCLHCVDGRAELAARLAAAEAALRPCALALEYRDGVTCREARDKGVCLNHRVIEGLRVHAVTADRLEIENRVLRRQVCATYGIIHEGLHGGKATDPEHQEACERPSCRNARAALAGSREQKISPNLVPVEGEDRDGR